jgi:pSer/pThr/pTyr-binding forkhead associated (FHA) protein
MSRQSNELFSRACEVVEPVSLVVARDSENDRGPIVHVLREPFAVVGGDRRCDLVLNDPMVSPRHCYLQSIGRQVLCVDLGGRGGVDLGDGPTRAGWLDSVRGVRIGGHLIRLAAEDRAPQAPLLTSRLPRVDLEFQANQMQTRWRMKRMLVLVGSANECAVRLTGASVSPYHCALVLTGAGLLVVDLLGEIGSPPNQGVFVNGARVRAACLEEGDVLRVGRFEIAPRFSTKNRPGKLSSARPVVASGAFTFGEPAPDLEPTIETIRRDYETQLAERDAHHLATVEELRREVDDLKDRLEDLPALSDTPGQQAIPNETSVRSLGSATRRVRTATRASANTGEWSSLPSSTAMGTVAVARPESVESTTPMSNPWPKLDIGLIVTTHDARPVS